MTIDTGVGVRTTRVGAGRLAAQVVVAVMVPFLCAVYVHRPPLSFEERVAAETAIEQVYWVHRIWPKENPTPKPALSAVLSEQAIRLHVEDYLKKSNALDHLWKRPITPAQLQAELDRIAAQSHAPQILREVFGALGNDPFVIAETLVRRSLADRLIREWYARDERFHGGLKERAAAMLAVCPDVRCMPMLGGEYRETTWRVRAAKAGTPGAEALGAEPDQRVVRLDAAEWRAHLASMAGMLGGTPESLPLLKRSGLEETAEGFEVIAVLSQDKGEVRTATVMWPKVSFDEWWSAQAFSGAPPMEEGGERFTLPATASSTCVTDTWGFMHRPAARVIHTAVWTGTEMIVWGGWADAFGLTNTGERYDPATDTWKATSTGTNVPDPRDRHSAVWTGTEMIVWGGFDRFSGHLNRGGRYDPSTDTWTPTTTAGTVPAGRALHTAVWTGAEMIVWGGSVSLGGGLVNSGGRYDPSSDTWTPTSTGVNVPEGRFLHTAVAHATSPGGAEMIVWGGYGNSGHEYLNNGGRYHPSTDTWTPTSTGTGVPQARSDHTAVWTGSEMIVWGGRGRIPFYPFTGSRYDPGTDTWRPIANSPDGRYLHTAVWTGAEMIVWGGYGGFQLNTGGRYRPSTDTWRETSTGANVPDVRSEHSAVWTGTEMIVWGGSSPGFGIMKTGGRYNPATDTWRPTSTRDSVPERRVWHSAVWTGTELIVWGGSGVSGFLKNTGSRYDPTMDAWAPVSTGGGVPAERYRHTAVWTGRQMVVWGGKDYYGVVNSGGRYDPVSNAWMPTSTGANVPEARSAHTTVWTGAQMVVWGGYGNSGALNTGGRYDPVSDAWMPTSMGANVPETRSSHTAVWTGAQMVVWGGVGNSGVLNTGGRYDPVADAWTSTSTGAKVPEARWSHTAVWTGTRMIVWGGVDAGSNKTRTGGRYDPAGDAWLPTSTGPSVPDARSSHTAVWTGSEMIVWGGVYTSCSYICCYEYCDSLCYYCEELPLNTGGRYDPVTDTWLPTSTDANAPVSRYGHIAVWTGTQMIVWGGYNPQDSLLNTGALYCACPVSTRSCRDADGDGYGDPAIVSTSCDGTIPAGYVVNGGDCNDAGAAVHPGATEQCNTVDDDCDGTIDNVAPPGAVTAVAIGSDASILEWAPLTAAQDYDVVFGDLDLLHSSGGDFTTATRGCLVDGTASTSASFGLVPEPQRGFWLVVRGNNCGGAGTYDSTGSGQVGSRDVEIASSPQACP
jgi:putative metal-binding protein